MFRKAPTFLKFSVINPRFPTINEKNYTSGKFPVQKYHLHKLQSGPSIEVSVTKDEALKYFSQMSIIRKMEHAGATLYKEKTVRGFLHLYCGQEAIGVGFKAALQPQDDIITSYRAHGWTYLQGASIETVISELIGNKTGCSRGKGGSMHMYANNFYGGNGIVGAQVPLGTGLGMAHKYKGDKGVSVVLYGDGASNQGQIFEAFNIAKLLSLPVIFICENNLYGMGTPMERSSASTEYYTRGDYIPGIKADGMDVLCTKEVGRFARDYVLKNGPIVVEFLTYRYFGHSMSDPGTSYRSREEVQNVRKTRDPINTFKEKMIKANIMTEADAKKLDEEAKALVNDSMKKARESKELDPIELFYDVYALNLGGKQRNCLPWKPVEHKNTGPPAKNLK